MDWDQVYRDAETVWGEKPDWQLTQIAPLIAQGRVLDLGMGEGRNAIIFAASGHEVKGIDISPPAVEKCRERALNLNIPIEVAVDNLVNVLIEPNSQSLIICAMALQFVKKSESIAVISRIKTGLQSGGFIYLTVFSIDDPMFARLKQQTSEVEPYTFYNERMGSYVHFFEKDEILSAFDDFKLYYFAQTLELDSAHPGVPHEHYHGILTYIGRKP